MTGWQSYVAVGDSFTEGMDDPHPAGQGFRGWADLVAAQLAAQADDFRYANLAVRGRLFDNIVNEQVPLAAAMKPDLISFAGGGNDALRRNFDGPALVDRFDRTIERLRATGADVIVFRFADVSGRLPGAKVLRPRVEALNDAVRDTAERHGAVLINLWDDDEFINPRLWSIDRLHMSEAGHHRVAGHVLGALGVTPLPEWMAPPLPPDQLTWLSRKRADARWATQHLAPWIKRRLTGRSSGDTITAKRPELTPVR